MVVFFPTRNANNHCSKQTKEKLQLLQILSLTGVNGRLPFPIDWQEGVVIPERAVGGSLLCSSNRTVAAFSFKDLRLGLWLTGAGEV
jgi:hypothetical protein